MTPTLFFIARVSRPRQPPGRAGIRRRLVALAGLLAVGTAGGQLGPPALVAAATAVPAAGSAGRASIMSATTGASGVSAPATTIDQSAGVGMDRLGVPEDSPPPAADPDPCTAGVGGAGGDLDVDLTVDGYARSFRLFVPGPIPAGAPLPLVVALHGSKDTGAGMERYTGFSALARRDRFIVAYPNGLHGGWAIYQGGPRGAADVDLVGATLDYVETHYCVDRTRVFAVGVSNGGGEASRVACGLSDRVSAVAIVAGDYRRRPPCQPNRPTSIFDIHSTADPIVPYLGVSPTHDGSVPGYLAMWRRIDSCELPGTHVRAGAGVLRAAWTCAGGTAVGQLKLSRRGHFWPGSTRRGSTVPASGSAAAEIWHFFSALAPRPS